MAGGRNTTIQEQEDSRDGHELLSIQEQKEISLRARVKEITSYDDLLTEKGTALVKELWREKFQEGLDNLFAISCKSLSDPFKKTSMYLHLAIYFRQSKTLIEDACKDPGCIHRVDEHCQTPLHVAVGIGNIEAVEILLKKGANPNYTPTNVSGPEIGTSLVLAITRGHFEIATKLLAYVEIDLEDDYETSSLKHAIASGNVDFLKLLLNKYKIFNQIVCIDVRKKILQKALHACIGKTGFPIIESLIKTISEIEQMSFLDHQIAAHEDAINTSNFDAIKKDKEIKQVIIDGTTYECRSEIIEYPIHKATQLKANRWLMKVFFETRPSNNPKLCSSIRYETVTVKYLKNAKVKTDVQSVSKSALAIAVEDDRVGLVQLFLDNGANPIDGINGPLPKNHRLPIYFSSSPEITELLLQSHAQQQLCTYVFHLLEDWAHAFEVKNDRANVGITEIEYWSRMSKDNNNNRKFNGFISDVLNSISNRIVEVVKRINFKEIKNKSLIEMLIGYALLANNVEVFSEVCRHLPKDIIDKFNCPAQNIKLLHQEYPGTLLHFCVEYSLNDMAKLIFALFPNLLESHNAKKESPWQLARKLSKNEMIKLLIEAGANEPPIQPKPSFLSFLGFSSKEEDEKEMVLLTRPGVPEQR